MRHPMTFVDFPRGPRSPRRSATAWPARLVSTLCLSLAAALATPGPTEAHYGPRSKGPCWPVTSELKPLEAGSIEFHGYWDHFELPPPQEEILRRLLAQENRSGEDLFIRDVSWLKYMPRDPRVQLAEPPGVLVLLFGKYMNRCKDGVCPGKIVYPRADGRVESIRGAIGVGFLQSLEERGLSRYAGNQTLQSFVVLSVDGQLMVLFNTEPAEKGGESKIGSGNVMTFDAFEQFIKSKVDAGDAEKLKWAESYLRDLKERARACVDRELSSWMPAAAPSPATDRPGRKSRRSDKR